MSQALVGGNFTERNKLVGDESSLGGTHWNKTKPTKSGLTIRPPTKTARNAPTHFVLEGSTLA
jgi:hypothetical protein